MCCPRWRWTARWGLSACHGRQWEKERKRVAEHSERMPSPCATTDWQGVHAPGVPQGNHLSLTVHRPPDGSVVVQGVSNNATVLYGDIEVCEVSRTTFSPG